MKEYDELVRDGGNGLDFPAVKFRVGAAFTCDFGLDGTFDELRLHAAVDRGPGPVYSPFRGMATFKKDYPERFGNLFTLSTPYGFDIRIGHFEEIDEPVMHMIRAGYPIHAGMYLGEAGRAGKVAGADGRHTHTEIVSQERTCPALDLVLEKKIGLGYADPYADAEVVEYCDGQGFKGEPLMAYAAQRIARKVERINDFICDRIDYLTGHPRRFYSSQVLFGM
ncbi:MAG: hypothetical protein KKB59_14080 [Spirochaetes bacterium]|nr:hypothetical protein [Spirochaetota bacterium]